VEQQPKAVIDHITFEISRSHTETHTHKRKHTHCRTILAEWSANHSGRYTYNTQQTQGRNMPWAWFETAIQAIEWLQN